MACHEEQINATMTLVEACADVDKARSDGSTPLFIACQEGHVEIMRIIMKAGASLDKAVLCGATPLFMASQEGHVEAAALLIANGASVNKSLEGWAGAASPLHTACFNGQAHLVDILLRAGANASAITK